MNIAVVIVTYNRVEKLEYSLALFEKQSLLPNYIIVVDNASTDGTNKLLTNWEKSNVDGITKIVIRNTINKGGSGGFYDGLEYASKLDVDWIWVSDDDAYPDVNALQYANDFLEKNKSVSISAICGSVINNGQIDYPHRRIIKRQLLSIKEYPSTAEQYKQECFEINAFSYVGAIINRKILNTAGLTKKEYFIWRDDTEHSLRLSKYGKIFCVPEIKIVHDVYTKEDACSWKTYYGYRNRIDMYNEHFPFICSKYFILKKFIEILYVDFIKRDKVLARIYAVALKDALTHNLGLHSIYKPGWKPNN